MDKVTQDLIQNLGTAQSPSLNTNFETHKFPGNNDIITKVESLTNSVSMGNVSDHDVSLLSLLNSPINETSAIPVIPIENSTSSTRISSSLKLSHIPESVSESGTENRINSDTTSVHEIINEVLNKSNFEGISRLKISEDPESIIHEEDTFEQSKGRKESLLDPINRLKELMNSQQPLPDKSYHLEEPLESNTEKHPSQESLSVEHLVAFADNDENYPTLIPFDTTKNVVDIFDSPPVSEELSVKFRKKRIAPEALISDDIKQITSRVQRINIYVAKLDSLKRETTGLQKWIHVNIGREPPQIIKNYRVGSRKTSSTLTSSAINKIYSNPALVKSTSSQPSLSTISRTVTEGSVDTSFTNSGSINSNKSGTSRNSLDLAIQASSLRGRPMSPPLSPRTKTSNFLNISNLSRHNSFSKSSRPSLFMPPAVMNDPSINSPTSPTSSNKISKTATSIKPRQRRLSFQAVTSRFSLGSSTPTSTSFITTIEEKNVPSLSYPNSIVADEVALNKLCDVFPLVDREILSKYLCAAGGKDDLMAVDLYMRDLKNGEMSN
ncbi:hypothetical protein RclHR1_03150003 [Rhizophagus clarus]|uniref:CUE domain-containing protein n=1 Tax=Rhizophagus clarus TaxID=94130 RepID=A0A2Z6R7Q8_9GLOM|nr:hypothetical protein RclHR1_03150003 [Rhizophagus clarus]